MAIVWHNRTHLRDWPNAWMTVYKVAGYHRLLSQTNELLDDMMVVGRQPPNRTQDHSPHRPAPATWRLLNTAFPTPSLPLLQLVEACGNLEPNS